MLRGEIRLVDLDPVRGSEANKRRPAGTVLGQVPAQVMAQLDDALRLHLQL